MRSACALILSDYIGGDGVGSGGAGHAALDSFRALQGAGADVRALAGFGSNGGEVATLGGRDLRLGGGADALRAIYNPGARDALAAALAREDPATSLVIVHQWTRYLSPAALAVVGRFPTMIYMHDYFWPCPNGLYYDWRQAAPCTRTPMGAGCLLADCDRHGRVRKVGQVARQAARRAVTRAPPARRLFLHLSERARRTAAPLLPGERHAILHNPLDIGDAPTAPPLRPRYAVGYFGRLEADKGVGLLIDAMTAAGLTGLFVGDGALAPALAGLPRIEHRAWQPRVTMMEAMRTCAVVVLPSLWYETWGLIVPEAMAAGVPVLVSARAGSAELVRRFGGGAIFDPGRPGDLAAKLAALLAVPPCTTARHEELRAFLAPATHAARLMALAESQFGLDLRADDRRISGSSARPAPRPAGVPPPPR